MIRRPVWDIDSSTVLKSIMNDLELAEWQEVQRINAEMHELLMKMLIARQVQAEIDHDTQPKLEP